MLRSWGMDRETIARTLPPGPGLPHPGQLGQCTSFEALDDLGRTGRTRIVPPAYDEEHRRACAACALGPDVVSRLEAQFIDWVPVRDLGELYGVDWRDVESHAAWYSLTLFRAANVRGAYARLAAAGLAVAQAEGKGKAPAVDVLRVGAQAIERLDDLTPASGPGATQAQALPGQPTSWEAEVRVRGQGAPPALIERADPAFEFEEDPNASMSPPPRGRRRVRVEEAQAVPAKRAEPATPGERGAPAARARVIGPAGPVDGDPFDT